MPNNHVFASDKFEEGEPCHQSAPRLCRGDLCRDGDSVLGSLVPALQSLLVCRHDKVLRKLHITNGTFRAVPTPNVQCDAATHHLITNAVFNLSSDVFMLAVGLPMFLRITLPLSKKIPLVGIFSLGVFVIIAAILNKVYSFTEPFSEQWVYWYVRESSTALIVANLPFVWLFYRKIFRIRSTFHSRSRYGSNAPEANGRASMRRKSFKPQQDMPRGRKNSDQSDGNLELGDVDDAHWSDGMTAEEMLRGDVLSTPHAKDATPITHPALFYADGTRRETTVPPVPELPEFAVLSDSNERKTSRRGSSPDLRFSSTPVSSHYTDGGSGPKAGSFV